MEAVSLSNRAPLAEVIPTAGRTGEEEGEEALEGRGMAAEEPR